MARFAGVKKNKICVISNNTFENVNFEIIEVPSELNHLSAAELITECWVKNGVIKSKKANKPAKDLKVAIVTNWKMRCGISTYGEHLYPEIKKHVGEIKLFIERNELPTGSIYEAGADTLQDNQIVSCWSRGDSLKDLVAEIKQYNPDVVLINHEFGLFPNARYWLSFMSQMSEFRTIVTMHSVFHHKDKTIVEAAMPEIVVHLSGAKDVLKNEKGIESPVHVIAHGGYPCEDKNQLWNFYKTNHTLVQFGYGFTYKNYGLPIKAVAILKKKYPDVFFTALFSESPYAKVEHQMYYNELMDLVETLDVAENVAILKGYQSNETLNSYLRTNKVAVFPYVSQKEHECFGASGAARLAMSKAIPVITSSIPHFSDLPSIKAETAEELAEQLDSVFSNQELSKKQVDAQLTYLEENSWENVAKKYIKIFAT